jgi:hypothetical protein
MFHECNPPSTHPSIQAKQAIPYNHQPLPVHQEHPTNIASYVPTGCSNAQLVSALDSSDAGTTNVGNVFDNGFPPELLNAAFGQELASEDVRKKMTTVGTGSNWGPAECLKSCGITRPEA